MFEFLVMTCDPAFNRRDEQMQPVSIGVAAVSGAASLLCWAIAAIIIL